MVNLVLHSIFSLFAAPPTLFLTKAPPIHQTGMKKIM